MLNRIMIVTALLFWYATVRMAIYHYFIPQVLALSHDDKRDNFDWWFAWFLAIPVTALSFVLVGVVTAFIFYGP